MLLRLLRLIAEANGPISTRELARTLEVREVILQQMIAELVRLGYLAVLRPKGQETSCPLCLKCGACPPRPGGAPVDAHRAGKAPSRRAAFGWAGRSPQSARRAARW